MKAGQPSWDPCRVQSNIRGLGGGLGVRRSKGSLVSVLPPDEQTQPLSPLCPFVGGSGYREVWPVG